MWNTFMEKSRNATIDIFRVVGAILIIMIHTSSHNIVFYAVANTLGRYVVPIFMMITGYFYYHNKLSQKKKLLHSLLFLWIIWQVVYIPVGINNLMGKSFLVIVVRLIQGLVGASIFYNGSWYLIATVFGICFVDYLKDRWNKRILFIIGVFVWLADCLMTNYVGILPLDQSEIHTLELLNPHSSIFTGVLWIIIAYFISENIIFLKEKCTLGLFVISFVLLLIEYTGIQHFNIGSLNNDMYVMLPISATVLFVILLKSRYKVRPKISLMLRNMATLTFFVQFGVLAAFSKWNSVNSNPNYFFLVVVLTLLVSYAIIMLSKLRMFVFLKCLY